MPFLIGFGVHPAYEIMANFSGLHMDMWGELEMVGTLMDQDIEMVPCETLEMRVPAHAEIVVEGYVDLSGMKDVGVSVGPTGYYLPKSAKLPELTLTAMTMRADRPIGRNRSRRNRSGAPWASSASMPPSRRATIRRTSSAATPSTGAK